MAEIHEARRERLRSAIRAVDIDAALITNLVNVRYLTGFSGSNAALLLPADPAHGVLLATDGRYVAQATAQAPDTELVVERACAVALVSRADKLRVRRLGFESHHVTVDLHGQLGGQAELVSLGPVVEELRTVKDEVEISALREAAAIADAALAEILEGLVMGRTERHVARELERRMLDKGAEAPAFETIVAAGENSAVPHHRPTDRRIAFGDLLKIDFGARVAGYHSDMTRTFVVGAEPASWQVELYDLVFAAQRAGREALAPGVEIAAVDAAARSVVEAAGHGAHFPHGLGHGVGLQIHEAPLIAATATGRLRELTPVTIEPGVYLDGVGGIRIEDTLVVRNAADGGPELLTVTTKELLVLD